MVAVVDYDTTRHAHRCCRHSLVDLLNSGVQLFASSDAIIARAPAISWAPSMQCEQLQY
jgi:hypothetical protein